MLIPVGGIMGLEATVCFLNQESLRRRNEQRQKLNLIYPVGDK